MRGTQPLAEVVPAVLAAVRIPVVAAGGVATPQRFAEVMAMGVDAVRIGTRFVTSPESGAHPDYVAKLLDAIGEDTVLTEWFDEGWPHAPHRVLRSAVESARTSGWRETVPPYRGVERTTGDMAMYAGMGVGEVHASLPARRGGRRSRESAVASTPVPRRTFTTPPSAVHETSTEAGKTLSIRIPERCERAFES